MALLGGSGHHGGVDKVQRFDITFERSAQSVMNRPDKGSALLDINVVVAAGLANLGPQPPLRIERNLFQGHLRSSSAGWPNSMVRFV